MPEHHNPGHAVSASPLARALAQQAKAQVSDLTKARGLGGDTFARLARRADELVETLSNADADTEIVDAIRARRAILRAVARLLEDPAANEIPPSNDAVYTAVLDVTELHAVLTSLRPRDAIAVRRILAHLLLDDADLARRDRLAIGFAAVCRRAGLTTRPPPETGGALLIELDRWPIAAASAVPLDESRLEPEAALAEASLRAVGRPGLILLEVGALLDPSPINVADDETAVGVMNERLDAYMIDIRDRVADATGAVHAFGLVVHATLPATNAASRRLLFAECLRAVNLCDADDARIAGFQSFINALSRAERPKSG